MGGDSQHRGEGRKAVDNRCEGSERLVLTSHRVAVDDPTSSGTSTKIWYDLAGHGLLRREHLAGLL